jgi:3-hydroxyacyl-[acyl-carrier-protein] dehydratase
VGSEIETRLPHRAPFLFVDEVAEQTAERIVTRWRVPPDLDCFRGHYPGHPILPGVLLCEFAFQSAAILAGEPEGADGIPVLARIEDARFKRPVGPGDELAAEVELVERMGGAAFFRATVRSGARTVLRVRFALARASDDAEERD